MENVFIETEKEKIIYYVYKYIAIKTMENTYVTLNIS